MGKAKTHQGTIKRIKISARGKFLRRRQMSGHLKVTKSPKRLRALRRIRVLDRADERRLKVLLPYA